MAEIGTTSIDQLPVNPQMTIGKQEIVPNVTQQGVFSGNSTPSDTQNVKIQSYGQHLNQQNQQPVDSLRQNIDYGSELNPVLKQAAEAGATVLPSRDIPQNVLSIQNDETVKPNYIPEQKEDYIGDILKKEKIVEENRLSQNRSDNMDYVYQQIQLPLLVAIIYFLFQLPFVRTNLLRFFPNLFNKDGNANIYGYVFNSVLFGVIYYILIYGMEYFTQ